MKGKWGGEGRCRVLVMIADVGISVRVVNVLLGQVC